ncbi:serine/threonine protein kinase [Gemmata sp. G18]|uniref:Serine/threonine protein kinase n=1 Tax=Gemmata palustris TaxID=2822762 RepID=A0ABS5C073_9BACT|nr:serine/threonine-protein kinase [Gemmata palustris]MBP3959387.1 serine/threonine protein kinase [Gemmata palustris]
MCAKTRHLDLRADTDKPDVTVGPRARVRSTPPAPESLPPNPPGLALSRLLGSGGMGKVYLALDEETKRQVAVKLLHAPGDPTALDRLQLEVRALAALAHPNVVTVFAANLHQHPPHYTMEFVPGGTLARLVGTRGPLAPKDAAELIKAVAHGTHATNQAGIVHRDIKPGNVLLQFKSGTEGSSGPADLTTLRSADVVPKLSDFGLAKQLDRTVSLTQGTGILGTPGFMAPEQVTNAPVTPRTDVYGLGATLYHALTGSAPFEEAEPHQLMAQIERAEPSRVRAARPEIPLELEAIAHKCLEKKPADRYATAEELADDLGRFLDKKPVLAKPLTPARRAWKTVTRNRTTLARVAAAVCVLASVFAIGAGLRASGEPAWEKIEKELAAGRAVTLVGATGEPLCSKWALGPAELVPGESGAPCSFSALDLSMLDLCRDPMNDSYQIRAELSQADVTRTPDGLLPQGGGHEIGLYFGRQTAPGANGLQSQIAFLIRFDELLRDHAELVRLSVPRSRATTPGIGLESLASVPFDSAKQVPSPWRTIEIDVTQAGIEARWIQPDGAKSAFRTVPLAEARAKYSKTHEELDKLIPGNGITYPAWNARAPIGIWAYRSVVTVRNVTLTPIP